MDLLYNLFTSTDKKTRETEFGNLIRTYHEQLSENVRKLGSDPDVLFPFETLKNELKSCGNFAVCVVPMLIQICLVDAKDVVDLNEAMYEGNEKLDFIQGFSESAQILYDERINDLLEDFTKFGYFHKLNDLEWNARKKLFTNDGEKWKFGYLEIFNSLIHRN